MEYEPRLNGTQIETEREKLQRLIEAFEKSTEKKEIAPPFNPWQIYGAQSTMTF